MPTKTKTKKEVYPARHSEESNGVNWRCKKCGDEIYWNTRKSMTYPVREHAASNGASCKCGALGVDGCEFYVWLIGNEADREEIKRTKK